MINKELLSKVLGVDTITQVQEKKQIIGKSILYRINDEIGFYKAPNIHELANKYKVYALSKGYKVVSNPTESKLYDKDLNLLETCYNSNFDDPTMFDPMLDILVCECIIEDKDKQND